VFGWFAIWAYDLVSKLNLRDWANPTTFSWALLGSWAGPQMMDFSELVFVIIGPTSGTIIMKCSF
jgi:hypothetical protein